jgi:SagB-type dehydrogenase family enzyme
MRVKVAECAALFWDRGRLVWDDYVGQRQYALAPAAEPVLRWFATWRELETARELGDGSLAVAEHLLDAGALIAEGSPEHHAEEHVQAQWGRWGPAARHFHFAVRTPAGVRYASHEDDVAAMRARSLERRPPTVAKVHPDRPIVTVAPAAHDVSGWHRPQLVDALRHRRSVRRFDDQPVSAEELVTILQLAGGIVDAIPDSGAGPAVFKTSPAAGAWHPIELYVEAREVDGLAPGVYHFAPTRGGLEDLGREVLGGNARETLGGQAWLADAPALLIYTAVIERSQWRYETGRAYRDVLIGLGHVSQTVLLTATAMGLGAVFATAVCDEELERHVGCDAVGEVVLGVAALGRPVAG